MKLLSTLKIKIQVDGKEKEVSAKTSRNTFYKYKNSIKHQYMN